MYSMCKKLGRSLVRSTVKHLLLPPGEVTSDLPTEEYQGVYSLILPGKTGVECRLEFCPNDVHHIVVWVVV